MNENDLSDEAAKEWRLHRIPDPNYLDACREWRRRAKANPWQLFSDEQLKEFGSLKYEAHYQIAKSAQTELERRKAK